MVIFKYPSCKKSKNVNLNYRVKTGGHSDQHSSASSGETPGLCHRDQIGPRVEGVAVSAQSAVLQRRKGHHAVELTAFGPHFTI